MRLPDLHRRLLRDALDSGSTYGLVLAGGYAIQAHALVARVSQDLDLATSAPADMDEIVRSVIAGLDSKGWRTDVVEIAPRMARLIVTDPVSTDRCELDILKGIFHRAPLRPTTGQCCPVTTPSV